MPDVFIKRLLLMMQPSH